MNESQRPIRPEPVHGWPVVFVWTEYAMQWVVYVVVGSATAKVACGLVVLCLASVPVVYVFEASDRQRAREHLQWLVLVDAGNRPGGGGVIRGILEEIHQRDPSSLAGLRLRDKDLTGLKLPGANLVKGDFSGTILAGADFERADLTEAVLDGTNLTSASLRRARLVNGRARNADLQQADLSHVDAREMDFTGADLRGARLSEAHLYMARFRSANLTGLRLGMALTTTQVDSGTDKLGSGPDLRLADFTAAQMAGVDLTGASLEGILFTSAVLNGAHLRGAQLRQADFSGAQLRDCDLTQAQLNRCIFRDADLRGARLTAADFSGADLANARLDSAVVGRDDWFDWLKELALPPVRISEVASVWQVVETQADNGETRFLIQPKMPSSSPQSATTAEPASGETLSGQSSTD